MIPTTFPQSNSNFGPPEGFTEAQVQTIPAYRSEAKAGSCDGTSLVVVAWKPNEIELARIVAGEPIFLTCLGGLPAHFLSTRFEEAINPA